MLDLSKYGPRMGEEGFEEFRALMEPDYPIEMKERYRIAGEYIRKASEEEDIPVIYMDHGALNPSTLARVCPELKFLFIEEVVHNLVQECFGEEMAKKAKMRWNKEGYIEACLDEVSAEPEDQGAV